MAFAWITITHKASCKTPSQEFFERSCLSKPRTLTTHTHMMVFSREALFEKGLQLFEGSFPQKWGIRNPRR